MTRSTRQLMLNGETYACEPGETVLEALLRYKVEVPNECHKQICLSCMLRSLDGPPPPESQRNLKDTLREQNYFLACACRPERDMEIALLDDRLKMEIRASVVELNRLNTRTVEVVLQCETHLDYRGGQSVILLNRDRVGRSFSIASPSSARFKGRIELHVERIPTCGFCCWVHDHLRVGEAVSVCGPTGQLFYVAGNLRQPLLLAASGLGLSALTGILQDAFEKGHAGPIYLFHGVPSEEHLYLVEEMREVSAYYPNFCYVPCIPEGVAPEGGRVGEIHRIIRHALPDLSGWRLFVSGSKEFVQRLQRQAYLDGASVKDIVHEFIAQ